MQTTDRDDQAMAGGGAEQKSRPGGQRLRKKYEDWD